MTTRSLEQVQAKIAALPRASRCYRTCPTWGIFETNTSLMIQRCDACWHKIDEALTDDDVALLPEAQAALEAERKEA